MLAETDVVTLGHQEDSGDIVSASRNDVLPSWTPGKVINLHSCIARTDCQRSKCGSMQSEIRTGK
jgi:hypothetical protein